jgi:hypothetical protein
MDNLLMLLLNQTATQRRNSTLVILFHRFVSFSYEIRLIRLVMNHDFSLKNLLIKAESKLRFIFFGPF